MVVSIINLALCPRLTQYQKLGGLVFRGDVISMGCWLLESKDSMRLTEDRGVYEAWQFGASEVLECTLCLAHYLTPSLCFLPSKIVTASPATWGFWDNWVGIRRGDSGPLESVLFGQGSIQLKRCISYLNLDHPSQVVPDPILSWWWALNVTEGWVNLCIATITFKPKSLWLFKNQLYWYLIIFALAIDF